MQNNNYGARDLHGFSCVLELFEIDRHVGNYLSVICNLTD